MTFLSCRNERICQESMKKNFYTRKIGRFKKNDLVVRRKTTLTKMSDPAPHPHPRGYASLSLGCIIAHLQRAGGMRHIVAHLKEGDALIPRQSLSTNLWLLIWNAYGVLMQWQNSYNNYHAVG